MGPPSAWRHGATYCALGPAPAATDESLLAMARGNPADRSAPALIASCWTDHPAGRWTYLVTMHTRSDDRSVRASISGAQSVGPSVLWDWRSRRAVLWTCAISIPARGWQTVAITP